MPISLLWEPQVKTFSNIKNAYTQNFDRNVNEISKSVTLTFGLQQHQGNVILHVIH